MPLREGDHLVIKREGKVLTPDAEEAYCEFEVEAIPRLEHTPGDPVLPYYIPIMLRELV